MTESPWTDNKGIGALRVDVALSDDESTHVTEEGMQRESRHREVSDL